MMRRFIFNKYADTMKRIILFFLKSVLFLGTAAGILYAAPKSNLWDVWTKHNADSTKQISYESFQELLMEYLKEDTDGINKFDYRAVTDADQEKLSAYIDALSETNIFDYTRGEQQAYWINLYNATTIQVVLDHYPVSSITDIDISPGVFSNGPWDKKLLTIRGEELSLNDIEHRILRPIWSDERIHYAVNCASIGCPNLASTVYTAENMEAMLNKAMQDYLNHPRGIRKIGNKKIVVSSIFDWYISDFGGTKKALFQYFARNLQGQLAEEIRNGTIKQISYEYDWSLNSP